MSQSKDKEGQKTPHWMVTYADMMALLLCLFVLLLSFSEINSDSFKQNAGPINNAFGITKTSPETPNPATLVIHSPDSNPDSPQRPEAKLMSVLEQTFSREIFNRVISLDVTKDYIIIRFPGTAAFPAGSATLQSDFAPTIKKIADILAKTKGLITVSGHTDSTAVQGGLFRSNWDLSSARAVSVVHQILEDPRVNAGRVTAQGFADTRPLYPNDTPENRAENRRVEIAIEIPVRE